MESLSRDDPTYRVKNVMRRWRNVNLISFASSIGRLPRHVEVEESNSRSKIRNIQKIMSCFARKIYWKFTFLWRHQLITRIIKNEWDREKRTLFRKNGLILILKKTWYQDIIFSLTFRDFLTSSIHHFSYDDFSSYAKNVIYVFL